MEVGFFEMSVYFYQDYAASHILIHQSW